MGGSFSPGKFDISKKEVGKRNETGNQMSALNSRFFSRLGLGYINCEVITSLSHGKKTFPSPSAIFPPEGKKAMDLGLSDGLTKGLPARAYELIPTSWCRKNFLHFSTASLNQPVSDPCNQDRLHLKRNSLLLNSYHLSCPFHQTINIMVSNLFLHS